MDAHTIYKHWFKTSFNNYLKMYIKRLVFCFVIALCSKYIIKKFLYLVGLNFFTWLCSALICLIISGTVLILVYAKTDEFKYYLNLIRNIKNKI